MHERNTLYTQKPSVDRAKAKRKTNYNNEEAREGGPKEDEREWNQDIDQ